MPKAKSVFIVMLKLYQEMEDIITNKDICVNLVKEVNKLKRWAFIMGKFALLLLLMDKVIKLWNYYAKITDFKESELIMI